MASLDLNMDVDMVINRPMMLLPLNPDYWSGKDVPTHLSLPYPAAVGDIVLYRSFRLRIEQIHHCLNDDGTVHNVVGYFS